MSRVSGKWLDRQVRGSAQKKSPKDVEEHRVFTMPPITTPSAAMVAEVGVPRYGVMPLPLTAPMQLKRMLTWVAATAGSTYFWMALASATISTSLIRTPGADDFDKIEARIISGTAMEITTTSTTPVRLQKVLERRIRLDPRGRQFYLVYVSGGSSAKWYAPSTSEGYRAHSGRYGGTEDRIEVLGDVHNGTIPPVCVELTSEFGMHLLSGWRPE